MDSAVAWLVTDSVIRINQNESQIFLICYQGRVLDLNDLLAYALDIKQNSYLSDKSQAMGTNGEVCSALKSAKNHNVKNIKSLDETIQFLIKEATEAREFAHCPYSNFKVGSAVLTSCNKVYSGCNIENLAFTVGLCAERCAYSKAISEGMKSFKAVVIVAQQAGRFTPPCGACRQFLSEFGDVEIYLAKPNGEEVLVSSLQELLPLQFETDGDGFD